MSYEYWVPPKKRCKRGFQSEGTAFGEKRCVKTEIVILEKQFKRKKWSGFPKYKKPRTPRVKKVKI